MKDFLGLSIDIEMPWNQVNSLSNYIVKEKEAFTDFENIIEDNEKSKLIYVWTQENKNILNKRFGRKSETPLHRFV